MTVSELTAVLTTFRVITLGRQGPFVVASSVIFSESGA